MGNKNSPRLEYVYSSVNQDVQNNKEIQNEYTNKGPRIGIRHLQFALFFALSFMAFSFRVTLSVGIVAMTDPSINPNPDIPSYPHWTKMNYIQSAFFWGYMSTQLIAAHVAKKYGPKWFLIGGVLMQSVLSLGTPLTAAHFGEYGMMASRAIQGCTQGFIFPSLSHLLGRWIPPQERSLLGSAVMTAGKFGTVVTILLTGFISASSYGWPVAFYLFGLVGVIWCITMFLFGFDLPSKDPRISVAERKYIEESTGIVKHHSKTPWKKILGSKYVWALFIAQTGNNYCFWTLLTQIPTYMNYVMNFNMKHNSLLSALPYMVFWLLGFVFGSLSDILINKGLVTRGSARKICNSIGLIVPAFALITLGFTQQEQQVQAVILLVIAVGFNAACYSGFALNHMDLSPNHAGSLMGLCNGFSQITGVLAPIIVQLLVADIRNHLQWRNVFFLAASINVSTAVIFIFFGSGEVQPWDTEDDEEIKEIEEQQHKTGKEENICKEICKNI